MAAHVFVIDSSARRQQIKTASNTFLRDVLEEACKKFNKDPEQFVLTDSGRPPKTLDLSLTMRLSGLVNGARLQLVQGSRSPTIVNVALKLPANIGDGQRLQDKFSSSTSLWLILRKYEEAVAGQGSKKLNLTQRGVPSTVAGPGYLEYEQPVIKIMQRELGDFVGLQKTLAQLGYTNGSVLLNLEFRNSGLPMEVAVEQISQYFAPLQQKAEEKAETPQASTEGPSSLPEATPTTVSDAESTPAVVIQQPTETSEDTDMTDTPSIPSTTEQLATTSDVPSKTSTPPAPSDGIAVYAAPTNTTPLAALAPSSESDFIPTIEHAHAHQAVLNRAAMNQRLLSDAELAATAQKRQDSLSAIRTAVVRVRFPDQMQVDITVDAGTTGATLHGRVRDMLRYPEQAFELRYTGQKGLVVLPSDGQRVISDLGWRGRVLVTMVWGADVPAEQKARVLKESLVGRAQELSVPVAKEQVEEKTTTAAKEKPKDTKTNNKADVEAKMKRLLGFGKKK